MACNVFKLIIKVVYRINRYHRLRRLEKVFKRYLCWFFGHLARGPVQDQPVLYRCDRCKRLIQFDRDRGWLVYNDR